MLMVFEEMGELIPKAGRCLQAYLSEHVISAKAEIQERAARGRKVQA